MFLILTKISLFFEHFIIEVKPLICLICKKLPDRSAGENDFLLFDHFVERRIKGIKVLRLHLIRRDPERFAEPLIMNDFTRTQEFDSVADIRVINKPQDIVVGFACLLFGGKILMQIGYHVAC